MEMNLEDIQLYKAENVDKADMKAAYKESAKAEHARHTRRKVSKLQLRCCCIIWPILQSPYTISILMQVRIVMLRRIQMIRGNFTPQLLSAMWAIS